MKAVAVSLSIACPEGTVQGGGDQDRALGVLAAFRRGVYRCFSKRPDALAELADAVLCKPDRVHMLAELSLVPECRRGHGAVYDAVNSGRVTASIHDFAGSLWQRGAAWRREPGAALELFNKLLVLSASPDGAVLPLILLARLLRLALTMSMLGTNLHKVGCGSAFFLGVAEQLENRCGRQSSLDDCLGLSAGALAELPSLVGFSTVSGGTPRRLGPDRPVAGFWGSSGSPALAREAADGSGLGTGAGRRLSGRCSSLRRTAR